MKTSLQTFATGIEGLNAFLTDAERQGALIGLLLDTERWKGLLEQEQQLVHDLSESRTDRKRYMYAVAIVSLYGLLERLVDSLIERFVARLAAEVPSYDELPEAIRKHHLPLSIELVKAIIDDKIKRTSTEEQVIANLHSCVKGSTTFTLNGDAFVLHRGNISLSKISGYLSSVGIDKHFRKISSTQVFASYIQNIEPERDIKRVSDQELAKIFEPIDDLVERRNEVSHGVLNVDSLEAIPLLRERLQFVSAYGHALYEVLATEALGAILQNASAQQLGKPLVVHNNTIVCFEHAGCSIREGDILVASTPAGILPFRFSSIQSIQIDGTPHPAIMIESPTRFAIKVSFHARDTYDYAVLPKGVI